MHCCYLEYKKKGGWGREGGGLFWRGREKWWKNWYSGGTTPLAGLIIRERDIEKAISDSGNHNLPEVELENIDGCVCVCVCVDICVCVRKRQRGGGREGGREEEENKG